MPEWLRNRGLAAALLLTVLAHLPFLSLPPRSVHLWRQSHTLAVARNFWQEGMNPMVTRVDNRFDGPGITGSHFPGFEFGLALLYHLAGESYPVQRGYCLILHLLAVAGIFFLARSLRPGTVFAGLAAWSFTWSPLIFYYAITALPDDLALPASVWGFWAALRWLRIRAGEEKGNEVAAGLMAFLLLGLAGLCKIQFLAAGFPLLTLFLLKRKLLSIRSMVLLSAFGVVVSTIAISWYLRAANLIETSGLKDFGITFHTETRLSEAAEILLSNVFSALPEAILNFAGTCFFLFAIGRAWKNPAPQSLLRPALLAWAGALVIYHLIELAQMKHHDYYMMPYLPLLSLVMAYGAEGLLESRIRPLAIGLLFLQPVLAGLRIIPARFLSTESGPHGIFYQEEARQRLDDAVPDSALCVAGPDNSRCIYFYFMHKKGFGFGEEGLAGKTLKEWTGRGAAYLYTTRDAAYRHKDWAPLLDKKVAAEGEIVVYRLKKP